MCSLSFAIVVAFLIFVLITGHDRDYALFTDLEGAPFEKSQAHLLEGRKLRLSKVETS